MTKSVLIEKIAQKLEGLSKKQTEVIIETIFESIKDSLANGGKVEVRGFGNFRLRSRNARKARNPKTGESVDVPPKKVPYFKVGKDLREMVNRDL
ncbi:MAG TPA: integration host factor subunit beta [Nitrospirae bacterium]|nr:DNA-binding protein HU [bacterium BMS3Abin06]HDH13066.1 integration host factor subunit beta [Nitrospirota bacterium]HDZ01909.1 integration host factor subunit beta [Nitrospirota bacterium]